MFYSISIGSCTTLPLRYSVSILDVNHSRVSQSPRYVVLAISSEWRVSTLGACDQGGLFKLFLMGMKYIHAGTNHTYIDSILPVIYRLWCFAIGDMEEQILSLMIYCDTDDFCEVMYPYDLYHLAFNGVPVFSCRSSSLSVILALCLQNPSFSCVHATDLICCFFTT